MTTAARIISWVFLPLFMPMYTLLLALYVPAFQIDYFNNLYMLDPAVKLGLIYMFGVFCTLAPLLSYVALYKTKMITTVELDDKRERGFPIIIMFMYCFALYGVFMWKLGPGLISKFALALPLSGAAVTFLFFLLNRWKKVSIHSGSAGISVGFFVAYFLQQYSFQIWILIAFIFVSGLIMSARYYLGKHTMAELLIGWCTGSFITFVICYWY